MDFMTRFNPKPDFRFGILNEAGEVIPATMEEWAHFIETPARTIAYDYFNDDQFLVSTVFIGLQFTYGSSNWFETMVFGAPAEQEIMGRRMEIRPSLWEKRVNTLKKARQAHREGIDWLKQNHLMSQ
jgi:hypothetical protein